MSIDLNDLNTVDSSNEGAVLEPTNPATGEKVGVKITLAGCDSDVYRKATRKATDKRLATLHKKQRQKMTSAEMEDEALDLLASCTLSWEGVKFKGKNMECTAENAKTLYEALPWLREQVDEFIGERANFIKDS